MQSLNNFNDFLDVILFILPTMKNKILKQKSFGILMNGIEGLIYWDETGDDIMK